MNTASYASDSRTSTFNTHLNQGSVRGNKDASINGAYRLRKNTTHKESMMQLQKNLHAGKRFDERKKSHLKQDKGSNRSANLANSVTSINQCLEEDVQVEPLDLSRSSSDSNGFDDGSD